jgi:hypothetical protein
MTIRSSTDGTPPAGRVVSRRVALVTASSLLLMAVLAPFAQFGVLNTLVVPGDPVATTTNIAGSLGLFQTAIAAFLIVAILDVLVARGFYLLLRPVGERFAALVGTIRIVYAAFFAVAWISLVEVAQVIHGGTEAALASSPVQAQVAASIAAFDTTWHLALGIFGLHLVGLGALLFRFAAPRLLAALVVVAGVGYIADSLGTIAIAGYKPTFSTFTFMGEALLIVWLFWRAARDSRSIEAIAGAPSTSVVAGAS